MPVATLGDEKVRMLAERARKRQRIQSIATEWQRLYVLSASHAPAVPVEAAVCYGRVFTTY